MSKFDIGSILGKVTKEGIEGIGNSIDNIVTSKEEKLKLYNELVKIYMESSNKLIESSSQIIIAEANGNWIQRSWRPILMLLFGVIVLISVFTETSLNQVPSDFWDLLQVGIGGYIGGRSLEKIADVAGKAYANKEKGGK